MEEQDEQAEMSRIDELVKQFGRYDPKLDLAMYKMPVNELITSAGFRQFLKENDLTPKNLSLYLGVGQYNFFQDLSLTSNILIAGAIGSGKTQLLYNQIAIWLFEKHPAELKFVLCGSKPVDYATFRKISRHFLSALPGDDAIITPDNFEKNLNALLKECMARLKMFELAGVRNAERYNEKYVRRQTNQFEQHRYLPEIILVLDDLYNFLTDSVVTALCTLMQMNTGTGIYVIAVTSQVASHKITKQLRSNFTFHAALKLMSQAESRLMLDRVGAEKLHTPGELFFLYNGRPATARQFMLDFADIDRVLDFIGAQTGYPAAMYLPEELPENTKVYDPDTRDPMFEEAARLIVIHQQGSTSLIQRKMKLGYNRAGRIIDQLEAAGIVGPFEGSKAREVLYPDEYSLERYLETIHPEYEEPAPIAKPPLQPLPPPVAVIEEKKENPFQPPPKPGFWSSLFGKKQ
jgi:S-DNA-T family DNA segregation ATPase FtsK/SpoIIIE